MKYYEAMATGRPFKRKNWNGYVTGLVQGKEALVIYWVDDSPPGIRHAVNVEELLADDWEVKEKEVMITKSQLLEAATQSLKDKWGADGCLMTHDEYAHMALTLIIDGLVKKLGLE
jgi:hypothetical protein